MWKSLRTTSISAIDYPQTRTTAEANQLLLDSSLTELNKNWYVARKQLKNLSLAQYFQDTDIVYINENLTRMRHDLFSKVWKKKKQLNWHSVWTTDGKIFLKKSAEDRPARIFNTDDLDTDP